MSLLPNQFQTETTHYQLIMVILIQTTENLECSFPNMATCHHVELLENDPGCVGGTVLLLAVVLEKQYKHLLW